MAISFDAEHDTHECLQRVASAIKQVKKLEGDELKVKIQACAGSWTSQEHDVNSNSHQQITEAMFTEDDNNYINGYRIVYGTDSKEQITIIFALTFYTNYKLTYSCGENMYQYYYNQLSNH